MSYATRILDPLASDRLMILIYHRVRSAPDSLFPHDVDARQFAAQIAVLTRYFSPLGLSEALARIHEGRLPPRAVCITFDDGYADNFEVAAPLLEAAGLSATFFIATDFLDGGQMWNDTIIEAVRGARGPDLEVIPGHRLDVSSIENKRLAIADLLGRSKYLLPDARRDFVERVVRDAGGVATGGQMLTSQQVIGLKALGMEVGAHTCSHPILTTLSSDAAAAEILRSKQTLEAMLGSRVSLFAYPNGRPDVDYDLRHVDLVRSSGFAAAVSTAPGFTDSRSDPMQLPRFTPWDRSASLFAARLFRSFFSPQKAMALAGR